MKTSLLSLLVLTLMLTACYKSADEFVEPIFDEQEGEEMSADTAVSSDIPTLILVGQYDVATPPRWATLTARTLSQSYLFEFPGAGHSLLSSVECAIDMTADFLNDPDVEPDDGCIDDIEWPYFE